MRTRSLLGGLYELLHQFGIVGNRLVAGDHANGVGIAGNAVIRFGKAVELWTVHVGLHTLPSGIETTEISLVAGQRLERGRADGHLVEFALTSVRLNHATDHRIGFVGSERGESLAVEILRGLISVLEASEHQMALGFCCTCSTCLMVAP